MAASLDGAQDDRIDGGSCRSPAIDSQLQAQNRRGSLSDERDSLGVSPLTHEIEAGYALFPATACQVRFWHEQKASPKASALNIAFRLQLSGPLDAASIEQVLGELVARHEILRTGFVMTGAGLRQQVWSHAPFRLEVVDLTGLEEKAGVAEAERVGGEQARTPFELSSPSFFRAVWLPRSATQGELQLTFHSLVMDGWSFAILVRELVEGLAALHAGHDPEFPDVDLHHGDYALWKEEFLASGALDRARAH